MGSVSGHAGTYISIIKEPLFLSNVSEESSENSELLKFSALSEAHLYRPMIVHTSSQNSNLSIQFNSYCCTHDFKIIGLVLR
jgi:hypothetical protein